jgi:DNA-binding PadR family transcriptional regulator
MQNVHAMPRPLFVGGCGRHGHQAARDWMSRMSGGGWGPGGRGRGGWGGWGGGSGWGRGPRARRGDVRAALLLLLDEEPRNGYQLIQLIEERTGGVWRPSPGAVYPALQQLEDEGLVRAEESEGRRVFRLTDEGRGYVEEHRERLRAPWDAATEAGTGDIAELRRLAFGLFAAVRQVAHAGSEQQVAEAKRILDDARRAIYRALAEEPPEPPADQGEV